jgi:hypothetical protein
MLVVDRREDDAAFSLGANRAEEEAEREARKHQIPVQVEVESIEQTKTPTSQGVQCITETPGPQALLDDLLKRVWNA